MNLFALIAALLITQLTACGGSDSGLALSVVRPFALTYANSSAVYVAGEPIIDNRPSVRGGPVDSYTVQPPLPRGLTINPQSGVVRGTPASPSAATIYTVTASNLVGSTVGRIQIEVSAVQLAPDSLRYPLVSAIYTAGQQIPPNAPVATGGEITRFTVDPSLPPGLSLDPQSGVITGAPAAAQPAVQYTVTGANVAGDVQASIFIAVQEAGVVPPPTVTPPPITTLPPTVAAPATVTYDDAVYVVGQPIVPNVPTLTGGAPTQFAVNPVLPDGLSLDGTTGVISGAPTTPQDPTPYALTASNSAGQAQTTLTLAVTVVGAWTPSGNVNARRSIHTASLRPGGEVLVAGGFSSPKVLNSAEIRSPAGMWLAAQPMTAFRFAHTSTTLQDGRVLVVGGVASSGQSQNSAEIFDTAWSPAAPMTTVRQGHTATLLEGGRVLVAGGNTGPIPTAFVEAFDAGVNTWTRLASLHGLRSGHTATLLADGRVLVAGGEDGTAVLASAEIYDPGTNSWTEVAPMSRARLNHAASLLPDGSVLVTGGNSESGVPTNQAELFDPVSLAWQQLPPMKTRRKTHTSTTMPNGQVVVAGGTGLPNTALTSVEVFDPASRQWLPAASMAIGRRAHTATLLPDGRLLVVAGQEASSLASSELFDISADGARAAANRP